MGTETKNKRNNGLKEGVSSLIASFDIFDITTLAVWVVGTYLIFKLPALKSFVSQETFLIVMLFATVLLFLMVAIFNQTMIKQTLKRVEERMKK